MNKRIRKKKKDASLLKILREAKPYSGVLFLEGNKALLYDKAFAEVELRTLNDIIPTMKIEACYGGIMKL